MRVIPVRLSVFGILGRVMPGRSSYYVWKPEDWARLKTQTPSLTVISLGAGVQSSVLALMAAHNELPYTPDGAIFADTGWEPRAVYEHLDWLEAQLPFPVYRVSRSNLREDLIAGVGAQGGEYTPIPAFLWNQSGKISIKQRQCTLNYKIQPIRNKVRDLLGWGPSAGKSPRTTIPSHVWARQLLGISTDEIVRVKPSGARFVHNVHPLIEMDMSRQDCMDWFAAHYPERIGQLPRSSCLGCPYHSSEEWLRQKRESPLEWADTCTIDAILQTRGLGLHRSMKPLNEVPFEELYEKSGFGSDCEGICGV